MAPISQEYKRLTASSKTADPYETLSGFGAHHESEFLPGALPIGQFSPQFCPYGLIAEKLSGTAFTVPRKSNQQAWLYRKIPAVTHPAFRLSKDLVHPAEELKNIHILPNQMRWSSFSKANFGASATDGSTSRTVNFVQSLKAIAGAGNPSTKHGVTFYMYNANTDMDKESFVNADGDFLIVPQTGDLNIQTEFGKLYVPVNNIAVIPRGIRFSVRFANPHADTTLLGYILEVYDGHFDIPDRGPIGANSLANERDFLAPVAYCDMDWNNDEQNYQPTQWKINFKFNNYFYYTVQDHTPYDVAAWTGNYYPYKYDLARFNTIGSISYDHPDPSIFTVLTCQSTSPGTAIADFVIFPPRWYVQQHSFRGPYYHRNVMGEFMGLIKGAYDGKADEGFQPGGASLHNVMAPHGPDAEAYDAMTNKLNTQPEVFPDGSRGLPPTFVGEGSMAFMFETCFYVGVTEWALNGTGVLQDQYNDCWKDIPSKNSIQP